VVVSSGSGSAVDLVTILDTVASSLDSVVMAVDIRLSVVATRDESDSKGVSFVESPVAGIVVEGEAFRGSASSMALYGSDMVV
jgi:hypothetical protein